MRIEIIRKGKVEQTYTFSQLTSSEHDKQHVIARIMQLAHVMDACTINLVPNPEKNEQEATNEIFSFFCNDSSVLPEETTLALVDKNIVGTHPKEFFSVRKSLQDVSITQWMNQLNSKKLHDFVFRKHWDRVAVTGAFYLTIGVCLIGIFALAGGFAFPASLVLGGLVLGALALATGLGIAAYMIYNAIVRTRAQNFLSRWSDQLVHGKENGLNLDLATRTAQSSNRLTRCMLMQMDEMPVAASFKNKKEFDTAFVYVPGVQGNRLFYVNTHAHQFVVESGKDVSHDGEKGPQHDIRDLLDQVMQPNHPRFLRDPGLEREQIASPRDFVPSHQPVVEYVEFVEVVELGRNTPHYDEKKHQHKLRLFAEAMEPHHPRPLFNSGLDKIASLTGFVPWNTKQ